MARFRSLVAVVGLTAAVLTLSTTRARAQMMIGNMAPYYYGGYGYGMPFGGAYGGPFYGTYGYGGLGYGGYGYGGGGYGYGFPMYGGYGYGGMGYGGVGYGGMGYGGMGYGGVGYGGMGYGGYGYSPIGYYGAYNTGYLSYGLNPTTLATGLTPIAIQSAIAERNLVGMTGMPYGSARYRYSTAAIPPNYSPGVPSSNSPR